MLFNLNKTSILIVAGILVVGLGYFLSRPQSDIEKENITTPTEYMTLEVFFSNTNLDPAEVYDCTLVYPVERRVPKHADITRVTLLELLKGPTAEEQAQGYTSPFSADTADILVSVRVADGKAYVDFKDFRELLPEVSASCGSQQFRHQVEQALKQFPGVGQVIYAIEKIPQTFYDFVGIGCDWRSITCDASQFP